MSSQSPAIILYSSDGYEVSIANGASNPAQIRTLPVSGSDGYNIRVILIDGSARAIIAGAGIAGTPAGGVVSVQGVSGGQALPISASSLPLPSGAATETTLASLYVVDNAGFTDGVTKVVTSGFIFDETAGTALTENDAGAGRIDSKRSQVVVLEDSATRGTRATIKAASTAAVATDTAIVVAISPNNALSISSSAAPTATTATRSDVASSATTVTLLSLNSSRKGATIYNDSTKILYVKFGTTASLTDFTVKLGAGDYYELPFGYTGRIDGIWASANGNARITELT